MSGEHFASINLVTATSGSSPREWGTYKAANAVERYTRLIPTRVRSITPQQRLLCTPTVHPHASGEHANGHTAAAFPSRFISTRVESIRSRWRPVRLVPVHPHASCEYSQLRVANPVLVRFIPSPVESMQSSPTGTPPYPVHPHACGEYHSFSSATRSTCGSSPRLWGVFGEGLHRVHPGRFIPTRVRSTQLPRERAERPAVYPHPVGSMAGVRARRLRALRFIPTPVGSMPASNSELNPITVHPHACGEYEKEYLGGNPRFGSSPRLWGVFRHCADQLRGRRFIPTPVGSIWPLPLRLARPPVHLHACREYSTFARTARGTPVHSHAYGDEPAHVHLQLQKYRFIPTPRQWGVFRRQPAGARWRSIHPHASGGIRRCAHKLPRYPVHPHASGEYACVEDNVWLKYGSSPRL